MKYKNNFVYVQKQINRLLRKYKRYVKTYVNDIIIFSKIVEKHVIYLKAIFEMLLNNNISIKFNKTFLNYFFVTLFEQKFDFLNLFTSVDKLKVIVKIQFSKNFRFLKIYFDFIEYFREYVFFYVDVFKSFQIKKIKFFKSIFIVDNVRKFYTSRIRLNNSILLKKFFFKNFQFLFFESNYFIYYNFLHQLFIDLNFNKKIRNKRFRVSC